MTMDKREADWAGLVDATATAARAVLPLLGVKGADEVIAAGEKMVELVDHVKDMVDGSVDVSELERTREAFEAAVNRRTDETIDKLRGDS
jgi:hypothetical protein